MGGKVVSLGSNNSGLVSGHYSAIGMGNKSLGVSIGIGTSMGIGVGTGGIGIGVSSSMGVGVGSVETIGIRIGTIRESLGAEVGSTGKSNSWLVSRDDGTVGVGHQVAGGRHGDAGGENQELHVVCLLC